MDNRLKEMNDYILIIEKKANLLINKYQKCNEDLKSAIQKIGELTNKLEKNESSIKDAKKKIDNLINNIKTGRFQKMSNVTIDIKNREFLIACEDGKEQEVLELAKIFTQRVNKLSERLNDLDHERLFLLAGILAEEDNKNLLRSSGLNNAMINIKNIANQLDEVE